MGANWGPFENTSTVAYIGGDEANKRARVKLEVTKNVPWKETETLGDPIPTHKRKQKKRKEIKKGLGGRVRSYAEKAQKASWGEVLPLRAIGRETPDPGLCFPRAPARKKNQGVGSA